MQHFTVFKDFYNQPQGPVYIWIPTEGRESVYQLRVEDRFHLVSIDPCFEDLWFNNAKEIQKYVDEHNGMFFTANGVLGIAQFIMSKSPSLL